MVFWKNKFHNRLMLEEEEEGGGRINYL